MKKRIVTLSSLAFLSVVTLFSSCTKDDVVDVADPKAKIQVVHASPDGPEVDILVDNQNKASLAYLSNTPYVEVAEGTRNIKVNVKGTTTTVINADVPFVANKNYSIFAIDSVSKISAIVLNDDLTTPAAGKAHVRFIHLSPNAPAVDVAVTGGSVLFPNQAFKSASAFTPVDAGTYNLEVRLAGTTTVALPLPGIALTAGKIYTVYARGFATASGATALNASIIVNN